MNKWTVAGWVALAAAGVGLASAARMDDGDAHSKLRKLLHGGAAHGEHVEEHLDALATKLELAPAQRKQVASAVVAALPGLEVRAKSLYDAHAEQLRLAHAREIDEEAIRASSAKVGAAQGELVVAGARLLAEVHGVLTPEQLARVETLHGTELGEHLAGHVRGIGDGIRRWAGRQ